PASGMRPPVAGVCVGRNTGSSLSASPRLLAPRSSRRSAPRIETGVGRSNSDLMRDPVTTIAPSPPLEAAATSSACAPVAASCAFAVPKLMAQVATASAQVDTRVQLRVFMTCSPQIVLFWILLGRLGQSPYVENVA